MVCPMRVLVVSIAALIAAIGIYLSFFWNSEGDMNSKYAIENDDEDTEEEDSDSSDSERIDSELEESESPSGAKNVGGAAKRRTRTRTTPTKQANSSFCFSDLSTRDLITGKFVLDYLSPTSLFVIGVAHVVGLWVVHAWWSNSSLDYGASRIAK